MSISDELVLLAKTKTSIRAAIEDNGARAGGLPFSNYASSIRELSNSSGWTLGGFYSFSRADAALYEDANGDWVSAAANVPRFTSSGAIIVEPAVTNRIANPEGAGGTPDPTLATSGTLPTGWARGQGNGMTLAYVDQDTHKGLPRKRFRLFGTATASSGVTLRPIGDTITVTQGDKITFSWFIQRDNSVGTGLTGISAIRLHIAERTASAGVLVQYGDPLLTVLNEDLVRYSVSVTILGATTTIARPAIEITFTTGAVINFYFYCAAPQFEAGLVLTSPIISSSALSHAADVMTLRLPPGEKDLRFQFENGSVQTIDAVAGGSYPITSSSVAYPKISSVEWGSKKVLPKLFFGLQSAEILSTSSPQTPLHPELGYGSWRTATAFDIRWSRIEASPGVLNWSQTDYVMPRIYANVGPNILYTFLGSPVWAREGGLAGNPPTPANYLKHVTDVVTHHVENGWTGLTYQLWNEPDTGGFFPGNSVTAFEAMIDGIPELIKSIDPTAKVMGPCVTSNGLQWMEQLLQTGVLDAADILSVNRYVGAAEPESIVTLVEPFVAQARRYGKPLHNTEFTYHSFRTTPDGAISTFPTLMPDAQGADYLVRALLAFYRAGVERVHWFGFDEHIESNHAAYSCIRGVSEADRSILLPPAIAYKHLSDTLAWGELREYTLAGTLHKQTFRTYSGQTGAILWRGDGFSGAVDLSGYSSGVDNQGVSITLSASYNVTRTIFVFD